MSDQHEQRPPAAEIPPAESTRGRHPSEEGEPLAAPMVPEDEEIVPNRHSASAEAAWLRWRETHDKD